MLYACNPDAFLILHTLLARRYGYGSAEFYSQILNGYGNASIPLETFVSDSQYMDHDQDFTLGDKFPMSEMKVRRSCPTHVLPHEAVSDCD